MLLRNSSHNEAAFSPLAWSWYASFRRRHEHLMHLLNEESFSTIVRYRVEVVMKKKKFENDEIVKGSSMGELQIRYRKLRALKDVLEDIVKANNEALNGTEEELLERMDDDTLQSIKSQEFSIDAKELLEPLRGSVKEAIALRSTDGNVVFFPPKTLYIKALTYASCPADKRSGFFKTLKMLGDKHLITRTIHAQTLSAWVRSIDEALKTAAKAKREGLAVNREEVKLNKKRQEAVEEYLTTYVKRSINVR